MMFMSSMLLSLMMMMMMMILSTAIPHCYLLVVIKFTLFGCARIFILGELLLETTPNITHCVTTCLRIGCWGEYLGLRGMR
jgi:hypothetical protein